MERYSPQKQKVNPTQHKRSLQYDNEEEIKQQSQSH